QKYVLQDLFSVRYRKPETEGISQDPAPHLIEQPDNLGLEFRGLGRVFRFLGETIQEGYRGNSRTASHDSSYYASVIIPQGPVPAIVRWGPYAFPLFA